VKGGKSEKGEEKREEEGKREGEGEDSGKDKLVFWMKALCLFANHALLSRFKDA